MSALTKLQIKQLKNADTLCVDFSTEGDGLSQIRAILNADHSSNGYEQTAYIEIETRVEVNRGIRGYNPVQKGETVKCFGYLHHVEFYPEVKTFVSLLKEGDEITAIFTATEPETEKPQAYMDYMVTMLPDYKNQLLNEDRLALQIKRGKQVLTFLVEVSLCPNNSARRIKHW